MTHLDAWHFIVESFAARNALSTIPHVEHPTVGRGGFFLALWVAAVLASWRLRYESLLALHAVVATALLVSWLSAARIVGDPWFYLLSSAWSVGVLLLVATCWTAAVMVWTGTPARARPIGMGLADRRQRRLRTVCTIC